MTFDFDFTMKNLVMEVGLIF